MAGQTPDDSQEAFEKAAQEAQNANYVLRLFISGNTSRSNKAILNLRRVCEDNLKGRYQLEVVDISQQPEEARDQQILVTPTLIKVLPPPIRRIIGDLSKTDRVLVGLDLRDRKDQETRTGEALEP